MANKLASAKRLLIDKANTRIVLFVAVSAFVTVFCLMACRALLSQRGYQSRVIDEKKKALQILKANNAAASELVTSYKAFVAAPDNLIGGLPTGSGDRDGDNAKIVLDALPSKYDFPALATSIEKVLSARNFSIVGISGTDDELNQANATAVQPVEMPFDVSVNGNLDTAQGVLDVFQLSIRPIQIVRLNLTGADATLNITLSAKTYYQPQKIISITEKEVQ